jgi:AraC-like DNA-binding protein
MGALMYFDPLTGEGFPLSGEKPLEMHVHECGFTRISDSWNYRGVLSPFWRAYHNLDGGAGVRSGDKVYILERGCVLLVPAQVRFDCLPAEGVRHTWVHFSLPGGEEDFGSPLSVALTAGERTCWRETSREIQRARSGDEHRLRQSCAALLLSAFGRVGATRVSGADGLRSLLVGIDRSLGQPLDVAALAARVGKSERAFFDWFKKGTGLTPMEYLRRRRIHEGCRRLRFTGDSIEQIAADAGFANRYHFSRVFRAQTGHAPAAYRKAGPPARAGSRGRASD